MHLSLDELGYLPDEVSCLRASKIDFSVLSSLLLLQFFLKLQITRAYIKSSMSLIGPRSTELDAIACLKNIY